MLVFEKSSERWWQKPLALDGIRPLTAELIVLKHELREGEEGAWLNSRGTSSGVADLDRDPSGRFVTRRIPLPPFVSAALDTLYQVTDLGMGAPDLVLWNNATNTLRFVEVKCPHWDRPSEEQRVFMSAANHRGIETVIVEWEFRQ